MTEPVPPSIPTPPADLTGVARMVLEVERQFHERDPGAFFVLPRVVRRVLQNELNITTNWLPPPHRKSCVVERDQLLWLVARDELGVDPDAALPQRLILIARPEEDRLNGYSREDLLRYYWRLLFHARIDFELDLKTASGRLSTAELRRRIDALGQTQFDEIRSVLRAELMLRRPDDSRHVYAEFVAVYQELKAFAPNLVSVYFPSLGSDEEVLRTIGPDCDAATLLKATRPGELSVTTPVPVVPPAPPAVEVLLEATKLNLASRSPHKYAALVRRAQRFRAAGNNVRAALVRRQAFDVAPLNQMSDARDELIREIEFLVLRLQAALELTDEEVRPWLAMCERLLPAARRGFWNTNARLLYDLQQVCLDHEQEIYKVDLIGCVFSRGKTPLKRPLPNQRIVMMSNHLRSASLRVPAVLIDDAGRQELGELLHAAAHAAELILRKRFEPIVAQSLSEVGFVPQGVVQRVAFRKMTNELLDGIVQRGFLTIGDLRDAISRNQLKMPDLTGVQEFFSGDSLLRADRRFAGSLDGVYQRGPFYLRWLQRLNALTFGIPQGRTLTRYIALPFGLAFLTLMALEEVAHLVTSVLPGMHAVAESSEPIATAASEIAEHTTAVRQHLIYSRLNTFLLGCVIFVLIHAPKFRRHVIWLLKRGWKYTHIALIVVPRRLASLPLVAWLLKCFPFMLFRRFVLAPLLATAVLWLLLPALGVYDPLSRWWGLAIFAASVAVLNSRLGRDTEELTREFLSRSWYLIRVHLLLGLFTLIVDAFQWLMDSLERVLYAVDEVLRFRSGESTLMLGLKSVLGVVWTVVHGVVRFCVTLLIEPQANPIKHFPVVTVSHKLLLPLAYTSHPRVIPSTLASILLSVTPLSTETANFVMATVVWGIPGIFGFLAWELKENWKLYAANRATHLQPVLIGHHGETLLRLLSPGFHSGTIPRLFARRRRAARKATQNLQVSKEARFTEKLNHEAESLQHFVERELIGLLRESRTFRNCHLSVGRVELATNRILVSIRNSEHRDEPLEIHFEEQSGWLIAGIARQGWLGELTDEDRAVFHTAIAGLYSLGAVDLVREQIESQLIAPPLPIEDPHAAGQILNRSESGLLRTHPYDISTAGLVVWPHRHYEAEIQYSLGDEGTIVPRPRSLARAAGLTPLPRAALLFREHPLSQDDWQAYWETEQNLSAIPVRLLPDVELLKPRQ
ncbi:MAG: hypothetical protein JSS49_30535 [Planctomycetes bacterium]|nr:hypothetical protein [Planctomycetota bacterium]